MRIEIPVVVLNPISPYGPVSGAQVNVIDQETSLAATVYVDGSGASTRSQPLSTDTSGRIEGWVDRGSYALEVTIPGRPVYTEYFEASPCADGGIDTDWLSNSVVTESKIANNAITSAKIASNAVGNDEIAADAVENSELADNAVGSDNIQSAAITSGKIAANAVTADKLASNIVPLGTVIDWWRPNTSTAVPTGWAVCDGTNWASIANDMGLNSGSIPNLVGKTVMGARLTTTSGGATPADGQASSVGDAYANAPGIGGIGGSNAAKNFYHSHYCEHTHPMSHSHGVPDHVHYIYGEAPGTNAVNATTANNLGQVVGASGSRSGGQYSCTVYNDYVYIPPLGVNLHSHVVNGHSHGGNTTGSDRSLTTNSISTSNTGWMNERDYTDGPSWSITPAFDNSSTSSLVDMRPAHVGLLKIMKVRNA